MRLLILLILFSNAIFSQDAFKSIENELQLALDSICSADMLPGVCISVVFNAKHELSLAGGYAAMEDMIPMKPDDRMLSGSTGKMFFSTVILRLIQDGGLSLDDYASAYLDHYVWYKTFPNHDKITIRNLMNHTSGLPRYIFQPSFLDDIKANPSVKRNVIDCIQSVSMVPPLHPVGEGWGYSDTNYILLGLIYEQITGTKIYDVVQEDIIDVQHLDLTTPSVERKLPGIVQGYVGDMNPFGLPEKVMNDEGLHFLYPGFEWTGGGFLTNARDLARLLKFIHESDYLSDKTKSELRSAVDMKTGNHADSGYGLGTFVWQRDGSLTYGHLGFFPGYVSYAEYFMDGQYAIAIQINHDGASSSMNRIARLIENIIEQNLDEIDNALIDENFEKQEDCWNDGDIECYMEAYSTRSKIQTISRAGVTYGYDSIIGNYQNYYPRGKMGKLYFDEMSMDRLSPTLYFVTGRFNLEMPERDDLIKGYFSTVCRKENGNWFIITDHSS